MLFRSKNIVTKSRDIPVKIGNELTSPDPDLEITNLGICKYSHNTLFRKTCADIHSGNCKECEHNYKFQAKDEPIFKKGERKSYFSSIGGKYI